MISHFFLSLNIKMHLEYKHSKGMSQEMTLGNLRWAQVHSTMNENSYSYLCSF